jgi:CRISPR/Cas system-associated endoribonuclease Cas2
MEEFRPLIAESTVLSCINNRVITEKDFVRAGQVVNLTTPGRKRFFQMYEQRMSSLLTHPLFDYKVSYRRALELQARLLAKRSLRARCRAFKTCRNFGDHLQYSVFECDLSPGEKIELETALGQVINHDEDQVLFVSLGPAEGRGDRVITALGLPYTKLDAPCYVV